MAVHFFSTACLLSFVASIWLMVMRGVQWNTVIGLVVFLFLGLFGVVWGSAIERTDVQCPENNRYQNPQ